MDDVWSAPSGDRVAPAPAPVRIVYRLKRERIVSTWPAHARTQLPLMGRPDVQSVLLGASLSIVALVSWLASRPAASAVLLVGGLGAGLVALGVARAPTAWRRAAEATWRAAEGMSWADGDLLQVELGDGRLRFRSSVAELDLPTTEIVATTRADDVLFLWIAGRGFVPVDLGAVTEGNGAAFWAAATDLALARRAPMPADLGELPPGAVRFRMAPVWSRVLRAFAATAVLRPVVPVGLVLLGVVVAVFGDREALLVAGPVGATLVVAAVFVREGLRAAREPKDGTFALAVEDRHLRLWSPGGGGTIPFDEIRRLHRWPGGAVWLRVGDQLVFIPRRAVEGDRPALLAALEAALRRR